MLPSVSCWKRYSFFLSLVIAFLFALPNGYGEGPALRIVPVIKNTNAQPVAENKSTSSTLDSLDSLELRVRHQLTVLDKDEKGKVGRIEREGESLLIHFSEVEAQMRAKERLTQRLGQTAQVSLQLAPKTPRWLQRLGLKPMKLGLDLRGGVHFLMRADLASAVAQLGVEGQPATPTEVQTLKREMMERTLTTLRNRVNELGVAEALVQRQGENGIVVELPGIQDIGYAKEILGKTATLKFLLMAGASPHGPTKSYTDRAKRTYQLNDRPVLTGESIMGAASDQDREGRPAVNIRLGGNTAGFSKITEDNLGKPMAVIYVELIEGKTTETVISAPIIQSRLGNQFQITGVGSLQEAKDLALLLRAGALPAAVSIVEERIVGPSMGQDNIRMGMLSMTVGLAAVLVFMLIYYGLFGLIADIALLMNLVFLVALMSLIGATLTLPGIAGIVLTLGMAVDASVLIFERIREEFRKGRSPGLSITRGFDQAFATILDSNLTTLIVGIVLFSIGSGVVKGFAVTLCLGILTSLFTSTLGTRVVLHCFYGRHSPKSLAIGI